MTIYLNCNDNPITYNKKNYLLRAAERMGLISDEYDWVVCFEDMAGRDFNPDYILNIEPCDFKYGTKWTGLYHIDNLGIGDPKYYAAAKLMDTYFTADLSKDPKAILLLQACDPELHRRIDIKQDLDFVISASMSHVNGTIYAGRQAAYAELKKHFTWVDLGKDHKPEEYVRGLNQAKVQFIHSMEVDGRGELAQRFFECLAIGPILTNWCEELRYTGLIEGQDFFSYKTPEEMIRKMKALLGNEDLRNRMTKAGRTAALLYHSYESRLGSIFNIAKQYE